jgi:hypothetical protein
MSMEKHVIISHLKAPTSYVSLITRAGIHGQEPALSFRQTSQPRLIGKTLVEVLKELFAVFYEPENGQKTRHLSSPVQSASDPLPELICEVSESILFKAKQESLKKENRKSKKRKRNDRVFALTITPPRMRGIREYDYGLSICREVRRKATKYLKGYARRHGGKVCIETMMPRSPGWNPKSTTAVREWVENDFRDRYRFFDRIDGMGRFHIHALVSFSFALSEKERRRIVKHIRRIVGSPSNRAVDFQGVFSIEAWRNYMRDNIVKTKRPSCAKKARLFSKPIVRKVIETPIRDISLPLFPDANVLCKEVVVPRIPLQVAHSPP